MNTSRELYRVGEAFSLHPVKVPELGGWEARRLGRLEAGEAGRLERLGVWGGLLSLESEEST